MSENRQISIRIEGCPDDCVIGGVWTVGSGNAGENLEREARVQNAKSYGGAYAGFCVLEKPSPGSYGLFEKTAKNARSLAAIVAGSLKDDQEFRIFLYHLKDGRGSEIIWMLMIDHGVVQVDGDNLVSVADGDEFFRNPPEEYAEADIQDVPFSKAMASFSEIWAKLSGRDRDISKITPFGAKKKKAVACACALCALIVLSGAGVWYWLDSREQAELLARKQKIEAESRNRISALKKSEFPPEWTSKPKASDVFAWISDAARKTPLAVNGWSFISASFENGKWSAVYERSADGPWLPPPGKTDPAKPLLSSVESAMPKPDGENSAGIMRLSGAFEWMGKLSFGRPWKLSWKLMPEERKTIRIGRQQITIKSAWRKFALDISGVASLSGLENIFNAPGLVIDSAAFEDNEWKLDAVLYVLP